MQSITVEVISDTHGTYPELQGADLLLHAGDWSSGRGSLYETETFFMWLAKQPHKAKVCVAGNHDFPAERDHKLVKRFAQNWGIIYLRDEFCIFEGFKIYGYPWQPEFFNWAFNLPRNGPLLASKIAAIPADTDIILTHGPPHGIRDEVLRQDGSIENAGCELLLKAIDRIKPQLLVCGHIHQGEGSVLYNETLVINASVLNEQYKPYGTLHPIVTLTKETPEESSPSS